MRKAKTVLAGIAATALVILALPCPSVAATGCVEGSGVAREETRDIEAFNHLTVSGVFEVRLNVGPPQRVVIRGDDNILPHILTEVRDGILSVHSDRSICIKTDLRLEIEVPDLAGFASGGTVTLEAKGIHGGHFDLKLDGTGNAVLAGQCERFEAAVLGTGDLEAENLKAQEVKIRLAGTGSASVYAGRRLDAAITGLGTVVYAGNPTQVNPSITGLGELIAR